MTTRIPFGFRPNEPPIPAGADPKALLAEVAQCLYDGVPLRPNLARWLCEVGKNAQAKIPKRRGRKGEDSIERVVAALTMIDELTDPDGDHKMAVGKAIAEVRSSLGLKASEQTVPRSALATRTGHAKRPRDVADGG